MYLGRKPEADVWTIQSKPEPAQPYIATGALLGSYMRERQPGDIQPSQLRAP